MTRWIAVSLVLLGCAGREVSKVKYTRTTCEGESCTIAPDREPQFAAPDEERGTPGGAPAAQPEPTCRLVGETLASLELGDYAEPEERAPKVAAGEQRCIALKLARDDRQCIVDSSDRASVAYCVPQLFPAELGEAPLTGPECDEVAKAMMARLDPYLRTTPQQDQRMWERMLLTSIEACRADRWNAEMAACARYAVPVNPASCQYVRPYPMYKRLEARLAKARAK